MRETISAIVAAWSDNNVNMGAHFLDRGTLPNDRRIGHAAEASARNTAPAAARIIHQS